MNPYETFTKEERIAYKTQTREIFKVEAINEDKTVTIWLMKNDKTVNPIVAVRAIRES